MGNDPYKNLEGMTEAINVQFPKWVIGAMIFMEMRLISPLEMGREAC